ncbi:hypothetical protein PHYC_02791 [Phycisphaerales bacterium]|nr:hypothetical protein PHYC_02791 [Phycisphaerales bacterium]
MADAKDAKENKPQSEAPAMPAKKAFPVKAAGIVAAIMVAEGAGVFLIAKMTSPAPAAAETHLETKDQTDQEALVEIDLVSDKFQNMQTGRVWVWDVDIVLKTRAKNEAYVQKVLDSQAAEIKEGVSMIFRRAQHNQLKEPGLETVNRQLTSYLTEIFGRDADGKDRLERVVIPKCRGFPAD